MKIALRRSALFQLLAVTLSCLLVALSGARADNPLEISMHHIAKAYKELAIDLQTPQESDKASYVALAATMKTEVVASRGMVPNKAEDLPPDQQAAMVTAYQKAMDGLAATIDTLTRQIQASQWDAARKSIATLKQQETDGHKQFRQPKD